MSIISAAILLALATLVSPQPVKVGLYLIAYLLVGYSVIIEAVENCLHGQFFDENFLMTLATVGALFLHEYPEAVAVMLFYEIGELFEDAAVAQSKHSISALLNLKTDLVSVQTGTTMTQQPVNRVAVGATIVIKPGERVPLDGKVIQGQSSIDTSALTGESFPVEVTVGSGILSGSINQSAPLTVSVTKRYHDSTAARILELVENASRKKTTTEKFVTRFAKVYTPVIVLLGVLLALVPPLLFHGNWLVWINRALIFLVISCPCALVISIPLSFFGGIGAASKQGVLVKGSNFLEALTHLETVAFDKTGTLTNGKFTVSHVNAMTGFDSETVLKYAAAAEQFSTHPIAKSIVREYPGDLSTLTVTDVTEISGLGIRATVDQHAIIVGNLANLAQAQVTAPQLTTSGTSIYISIDQRYAGEIQLSDHLKNDAIQTISTLKQQGIQSTVLLTGDRQKTANQIGFQLGIDQTYAELLPEQKVAILTELIQTAHANKKTVAFVGDGINDTPVLARADVGIAMGGLGADAAIDAADIVIMNDQPSKLTVAIKVARKTSRIVWENIIFALAVKLIFLSLGAFGIVGMWEAVFADVGVTLIAIFNALRLQRFRP